MPGITLSADEIKTAPPEVRHWLEQEITRAFSVQPTQAPVTAPPLVGCNVKEARDILSLVQGMLPVVSVFFELGLEGGSVSVHGMRAFRIADILRHVRLHVPEQVVECLDVLGQALQRVRADPAAEATMLSILRLWQDIVVQRGLQREPVGTPQQPSEVAGA